MRRITILKGLPASGKSTYAKRLLDKFPGCYKRINKDEIRAMLDNGKWSKSNEKFVLEVRDCLISMALQEGKHVIVDDTNFAPKHEERIRQLVNNSAGVEVKFFDTPLEECISRDLARSNSVGEKVIRDMYNQYLKPEPKKIEWDESLASCIIVDIDGTVAKMNGRGPYDFEKVGEDLPNTPILRILIAWYLANPSSPILFVSGRGEEYRKQTEEWLAQYVPKYEKLFMRPAGNKEKDSLIKERIFEQEIRGKYNVHFVLDDRTRIVEIGRAHV